jgi:carboxyl-terminal processing protease
MTAQNLKTILIAVAVCLFCYVNAARMRKVGDLGLVMDLIDEQFVDESNNRQLYNAAMKGIFDSLDPYSGYVPPEKLGSFQAYFDQEFGGLGISVDGPPRIDRLTVIAAVYNSPAYREGIKPGDVIIQINSEPVGDTKVEELTPKLRGVIGTQVQLTIEREGEPRPLEFNITRGRIEVESVVGDHRTMDGRWEHRMQANRNIGYFRIELFGEKTSQELKRGLESMASDCKGVILDLRDNSGGLLIAATEICDMFLNDGEIVKTQGRHGRVDDQFTAEPGEVIGHEIPIVVIINDQSASASEVLAACLQDRKRAVVVGVRSYGKGSVQNVIPLEGGTAAMRLTTAYYYPPSGRLIHRRKDAKPEDTWGVHPNEGCVVEIDEEGTTKLIQRIRRRSDPMQMAKELESHPNEDSSLSDDPQLQRALEIVQSNSKVHTDTQP